MKLSIITINYNNKDGLQKTINSVITQTYKDFEWIIIDGGSTDGSKELIEKYADYITYWVSEPDKGIYNAMNKGILASQGEYLYFLNSGDLLYNKDTLSDIFKREYISDVLYGNNKNCKNHIEISETIYFSQLSLKTFIKGTISHQVAFFRKECFKDYLYDEKYKFCSDSKHFIYLMINGYKFEYLDFFVASVDISGCTAQKANLEVMKEEKKAIINELITDNILKDYRELLDLEQDNKNELVVLAKRIFETNRYIRTIVKSFMKILLNCYKLIH